MAQRKVTAIPATITKYTAVPIGSKRKRRVAGYARVSTDHEDQVTSYEAQVDYYTNYIKGRDDWEFVAIYTDEGISATNTKRREGFKAMVADALAGKIDLIVTKSVSRFARNTVDSLTTVRTLKEKGVEIYFEKENIWTLDAKGELLITIMSSLAQEESRSISENTTWGQRKRFADGKASVAYKRFLGYDRGPNGGFVVNQEQAKTVKLIYKLFLDGLTCHAIAKELTERKLPTPGGKAVWSQSTVRSILTNEKYKGDALLQKEFTVDFLKKKTKKNEGEIPQYYVEGNHEAIRQGVAALPRHLAAGPFHRRGGRHPAERHREHRRYEPPETEPQTQTLLGLRPEPLGQLIDFVGGVGREQLHEPQQHIHIREIIVRIALLDNGITVGLAHSRRIRG